MKKIALLLSILCVSGCAVFSIGDDIEYGKGHNVKDEISIHNQDGSFVMIGPIIPIVPFFHLNQWDKKGFIVYYDIPKDDRDKYNNGNVKMSLKYDGIIIIPYKVEPFFNNFYKKSDNFAAEYYFQVNIDDIKKATNRAILIHKGENTLTIPFSWKLKTGIGYLGA